MLVGILISRKLYTPCYHSPIDCEMSYFYGTFMSLAGVCEGQDQSLVASYSPAQSV